MADRKQMQGDTIVAHIGEGASSVSVGKNIIHIGTLEVPMWIAIIIVLGVAVGAIAVVYYGMNTTSRLDRAQVQMGEVKSLIQATATPMPTSTPTPTPTPEPMQGDFNIAIAAPLPLQHVHDPQIDNFLNWYPDKLKTQLEQDFQTYRTTLKLKADVRIVPIVADDLNGRHDYYADYAQRIGAHVMLYGVLDLARNPPQFRPEFYVHPKLQRGAPETTGPDAFGDPIDIRLSASGADELVWKSDLNAPIADLSAFMIGLAFFNAGEYDLSQEQFEKLDSSDEWATNEGKAILYLWLGTTHFFKALEQRGRGVDPKVVRCLASGEEVTDSECARQSYELARDLKEDYPRAYIGLGNYWLEFADMFGCGRFEKAIEQYETAMARAEAATDYDEEFLRSSLATMKTLYQLGLTHARALRECAEIQIHDEKAVAYLQQALGWYDQADAESQLTNSMLRDLASRSSYMLGLVHKWRNRDDDALEALEQTVEIATPSNELEDPWQSIRWVAKNQIGAIYLTQVEAGNFDAFERARDVLYEVTHAYEGEQFGSLFPDEPVAAAAAYYHLGRLYLAMAQSNANQIDVSRLQDAETVLNQGIQVLEHDMDPGIVENLRDGLPWISYVELGHVYRLWSESGDTFRQEDALTNYRLVFDAFDAGKIVDGQVAIDVFAEAAYGAGAIYAAQGKHNDAVKWLTHAIKAGEKSSKQTYVKNAEVLLDEISEQTASE
jgi:tetratricopeptide (TPR) repeat protein